MDDGKNVKVPELMQNMSVDWDNEETVRYRVASQLGWNPSMIAKGPNVDQFLTERGLL